MKTALALLACCAAASAADGAGANASERLASLRRRLSLEKIAGYSPGSQVTDNCAIDLDQKAIEEQLAKKTPGSFEAAQAIYQQGGHSKSYAQVTLQEPLENEIKEGTPVMGENADGKEVSGEAYEDYAAGQSVIQVRYSTTDLQEFYVGCQVGGLPEGDRITRGCFRGPAGTLKIGREEHAYTYDAVADNKNGRTIAKFTTEAGEKMRTGEDCRGCPYRDHGYFYEYYGSDTYADDWIMYAFRGEKTTFRHGNADFSVYGFEGREQVIKKGTAYMSIFMHTILELERALDACELECMECNDESVHSWDKGVCYYTGSIERQDGRPEGSLLHQLSDERCIDFRTCGVDGSETSGRSKLNYDLFDLFALGSFELATGNCPAARATAKKIVDKMYVPLIQGAIRQAYRTDKIQGGEMENAEGAAYAAAVLPRVYAASPQRANIIYWNLNVNSVDMDIRQVKHAFEHVYADLGITCGDVGGLWDDAKGDYYPGMEPCADTVTLTKEWPGDENNATLVVVLGVTFGVLLAIGVVAALCLNGRGKEDEPVFKGPSENGVEVN